jgi:preprotein translocase subunit YajC
VGGTGFLFVMVLLLVVMYVLMIRPQRRRQQEQQDMVNRAGVGDDVLTTGGIYGTITEADGDEVVVEIAPEITVHMTRRGIAAVLPPEEADEAAEDIEGDEADEAAVMEREGAVSSGGDAEAAAENRR